MSALTVLAMEWFRQRGVARWRDVSVRDDVLGTKLPRGTFLRPELKVDL